MITKEELLNKTGVKKATADRTLAAINIDPKQEQFTPDEEDRFRLARHLMDSKKCTRYEELNATIAQLTNHSQVSPQNNPVSEMVEEMIGTAFEDTIPEIPQMIAKQFDKNRSKILSAVKNYQWNSGNNQISNYENAGLIGNGTLDIEAITIDEDDQNVNGSDHNQEGSM